MDNPGSTRSADVQYPLELSAADMLRMVAVAMDHIVRMVDTLPEQPVDTSRLAARDTYEGLVEPLPREGACVDDLLEMVFRWADSDSLNPVSPGFMGYVPGGGLFHAAVADLVSDALNRYVGMAGVAPLLNLIEANVVRWFCEIVGYPTTARGYLTSGGSLANLGALITARQTLMGEAFSAGTIYLSDQAHHCLTKAARIAGLPRANVRVLPSDDHFCLDPQILSDAVAADRAAGMCPFFVGASAGTTNTGAVDPLGELAEFCRRESLWFHIDGAYGGLFCLTERGRRRLQGIQSADSVVLDPHKTLFLPYGTGALLVRDGGRLRQTFSSSADYLPAASEPAGDDALMDFADISPELTRPFRGLRVWLPLKMHGAGAFERALDEKLDLAAWAADQIAGIPGLTLLAGPELSILAFACAERGDPVAARNKRTLALLEGINRRNRVHLTATVLDGIRAIRVAVVGYRTHKERMHMLVEDIAAALAEVESGPALDASARSIQSGPEPAGRRGP